MQGTTEGATRLAVDAGSHRGPKARGPAFYNPAMRLNRDLSVLLVSAYAADRGRPIDVADVLAGAGARSLRLANEVPGDITVHANDADPAAIRALQAGKRDNGIGDDRLQFHHGDAHAFLASRRFDIVDIDPYGTPAPFIDGAVRATRHGGLVCITATDTAALSGRFPRVCQRRYGASHPLHAQAWRSEVGLRILAGTVVRAAGRHERSATPVLSVFGGHWMRVVLRVEDGSTRADRAWRNLGHATVGELGGGRFLAPDEPVAGAGPLWTGPLHDGGLLASMASQDLPVAPDTKRLVAMMQAEADAPAFWHNLDTLRGHLGPDAPRRDVLIQRLQEAGRVATRSHLDPVGVRSDATAKVLLDAWST